MFAHPATRAVCRHCGADAGYMDEVEMCFRCGPVCANCYVQQNYPCEQQIITLPPRLPHEADKYNGA